MVMEKRPLLMEGALKKGHPRSGKGKDESECPVQEYEFFVARQGETETTVVSEEETEAKHKEDSRRDKSVTFFLSE
jgi:hypothetical protein